MNDLISTLPSTEGVTDRSVAFETVDEPFESCALWERSMREFRRLTRSEAEGIALPEQQDYSLAEVYVGRAAIWA